MPENIEKLKGKRVLVTGGAGFIGSHIVDRLSPDNEVTVLDNLFHGSPNNLAASKDRIKFVNGDVLDKELVDELVSEAQYIFHLAGCINVIRSIEKPEPDMKVNIQGTLNVLEACRKATINRLVFSSSAAVFGEAKYLPIDEDHPLNPESPYAVSKMAAEKYTFAYYKVYGIPTVSIRYFNIYGPRQDASEYANAVSIFLGKFKTRQPITIYGDGEQTRDFVFVQDAVTANILAATHPEAVGEIFNIATGKAISLNKVVKIIQQVSGWEGQVNYAPARAGEIKHSRATIKKAREMISYHSTVGLEQGLKITWDSLK